MATLATSSKVWNDDDSEDIDVDAFIEAKYADHYRNETPPSDHARLLGHTSNGDLIGPENEENGESDWHTPYGNSIYTLFYMCEFDSIGFMYAVFIYAIQIITITLTLVDIVDPPGSDNPLRVPPMVPLTVTIAQGVTVFIALAYMSDLIEALTKLQGKWNVFLIIRN